MSLASFQSPAKKSFASRISKISHQQLNLRFANVGSLEKNDKNVFLPNGGIFHGDFHPMGSNP